MADRCGCPVIGAGRSSRTGQAGVGADTGISTSEVYRICKDLDTEVALFSDRPLSHTVFPSSSWTPPTARYR